VKFGFCDTAAGSFLIYAVKLWGNLDCVMKETSGIVLCAVFAAFREAAIKFNIKFMF
jgi:hypothetical protein